MGKIIIKDDNDTSNSFDLKNFEVISKSNALLLNLYIDNITIKYIIHSDAREPDIAEINTFLTTQLENARAGAKDVKICEYLKRSYIYIETDNDIRQFTANKI